jgi:hypothetical protein
MGGMKINNMQKNPADYSYNSTGKINTEEKEKVKQGQKTDDGNSEVIQASDLTLVDNQDTALQKLFGQKAALQIRLDQFAKELGLDDEIQGHADNRETLLEEAGSDQREAGRLKELQADLKDTFGIDDESTEHQDFLILEKKQLNKELTSEEQERLKQMGSMTEYQKEALSYSNMIDTFQKRADKSAKSAIIESKIIVSMKLERLKSHPMADANEQAEDLLKQVDDEIKKTLAQEVANRVKENLNLPEEDLLLNNPQALVEKKKVIEEDLKGFAVDEKV